MVDQSLPASAIAAIAEADAHVQFYAGAILEFVVREDFSEDDPRYKAYKEGLKEANERLKEANKRLKEAREYQLQLTLGVSTKSLSEDPFFTQVGTAKEENNMLTFSTRIPLTDRLQLYIRRAYKVIYEAVVHKKDATLPKYAIVTGTPGIGKSSFLYYVFWRMVKEKQRVLFVTMSKYFDGECMWEISAMPHDEDLEFWTNDLWCLVDSADLTKIPGLNVDRCSIILATTPQNDYVADFKKLVPIPPIFYMPRWSHDELQSIAPLYPDVDADTWENRFALLGGVPRCVLEDVSTPPETLLKWACSQCSLKDAIHLVSIDSLLPIEQSNVIPTFIHLHSKDPYTQYELRFASPTALILIAQTHWHRFHREMQTLLGSAKENPLVAALCEYILEGHGKKLLEKGGQLEYQELVESRAPKKAKVGISVPPSSLPAIVADEVPW